MGTVDTAGEADSTFVQSFDWRSLLLMHEQHPDVQTVALYGDFLGGPGQGGTNLPDFGGENTPCAEPSLHHHAREAAGRLG